MSDPIKLSGIPVPEVTRASASVTNPMVALEVGECVLFPVGDEDLEKVRRRVQSRAAYATKHRGYKFAIRVVNHPIGNLTAESLPAIGAWRLS